MCVAYFVLEQLTEIRFDPAGRGVGYTSTLSRHMERDRVADSFFLFFFNRTQRLNGRS